MKKIILFVLTLLIALQMVGQSRIVARRETIDLGPIIWKIPVTAEFTVSNKGHDPLIIEDIESSCECTTIEWSNEPIAYNESQKIKVEYDAKQLGRFQKQILVHSNSLRTPLILTIKGHVVTSTPTKNDTSYPHKIGTIRVNKKSLDFEDISQGEKPMIALLVHNIGVTSYTPELMHLPSYITAQYQPERILGGETGKIIFTLDTEQLKTIGEVKSQVYISRFPGDIIEEENCIDITATILPNLTNLEYDQLLNAPKITLSAEGVSLNYQQKGGRRKTLIVENQGFSTLEINTLQTSSTALGISLSKRIIKPGEKSKLKISLHQQNRQEEEAQLLLFTNDPERQKVTIPIHISGEFKTFSLKQQLIGWTQESDAKTQPRGEEKTTAMTITTNKIKNTYKATIEWITQKIKRSTKD